MSRWSLHPTPKKPKDAGRALQAAVVQARQVLLDGGALLPHIHIVRRQWVGPRGRRQLCLGGLIPPACPVVSSLVQLSLSDMADLWVWAHMPRFSMGAGPGHW